MLTDATIYQLRMLGYKLDLLDPTFMVCSNEGCDMLDFNQGSIMQEIFTQQLMGGPME